MRKIFVVIERRADYSRFKPILMLLKDNSFFTLHLVVTGVCLLPDHGYDIQYIKKDGFHINTIIPMFLNQNEDTGAEMVRAMGRFMIGVADELEKEKPDIVLTGFDIGANFATSVAAAHMNIPVFHIQGGEISGSIDESLRHAMSKFAHVHFPATKLSKQRLIRMGENPKNIFVVGCPSINELLDEPQLSIKQLKKKFRIDFSKPVIVIIQHPVTTEDKKSYKQIENTIEAIREFHKQTLVLLPNNDAGCRGIIRKIQNSNIQYVKSVSTLEYANLLRHISVLVGNSSSGIHEASSFYVPVVNIGTRQQGREKTRNVIDVFCRKKDIRRAVHKALFDQKFRKSLRRIVNPYEDPHSVQKIVKILMNFPLKNIVQKKFYE